MSDEGVAKRFNVPVEEVRRRRALIKPRKQLPPMPDEIASRKIVEQVSDGGQLVCVNYEGWQERHPDTPYDRRFAYPDAVRYCGDLLPRTKLFAELTLQDEIDWDVLSPGRTILAKDRNLNEFYNYH